MISQMPKLFSRIDHASNNPSPMDQNDYNKEYLQYLEYALQRYLIDLEGYSETDARTKVLQDFALVEEQAKKAGYL